MPSTNMPSTETVPYRDIDNFLEWIQEQIVTHIDNDAYPELIKFMEPLQPVIESYVRPYVPENKEYLLNAKFRYGLDTNIVHPIPNYIDFEANKPQEEKDKPGITIVLAGEQEVRDIEEARQKYYNDRFGDEAELMAKKHPRGVDKLWKGIKDTVEERYDRTFENQIELHLMNGLYAGLLGLREQFTEATTTLDEKEYVLSRLLDPSQLYEDIYDKGIIPQAAISLGHAVTDFLEHIANHDEHVRNGDYDQMSRGFYSFYKNGWYFDVERQGHEAKKLKKKLPYLGADKNSIYLLRKFEKEDYTLDDILPTFFNWRNLEEWNHDTGLSSMTRGLMRIKSETGIDLVKQAKSKLREWYKAKDPQVKEFIEHITPTIISEWQVNADEYRKVFSTHYETNTERDLISGLASFIYDQPLEGESRPNFPTVIHNLMQDGYIDEKQISPKLVGVNEKPKIMEPNWDSLTSEADIISRQVKELKSSYSIFTDDNDSDMLPVKSRRINTSTFIPLEEIAKEVEYNVGQADMPDVPLREYNLVIPIEPETFIENFSAELILALDLNFKHYKAGDLLETKGKTWVRAEAKHGVKLDMTLHPEMAILKFHTYKSNMQGGIDIYATKLLLESHFAEKGITTVAEHRMTPDHKLLVQQKINSQLYAQEKTNDVSQILSNSDIIRLIDYANHHAGFRTEITGSKVFANGKKAPTGTLWFSKKHDFLPQSPISHPEFHIPLEQLYTLANTPEEYRPRINELEIIQELVEATKSWEVLDIPENAANDFMKVYKTYLTYVKHDEEATQYYYDTHGGFDFEKEELEDDPSLERLLDQEIQLNHAADVSEEAANKLATEFLTKISPGKVLHEAYQKMPGLHVTLMYNTLHAKYLLEPESLAPATLQLAENLLSKK